MHVTEIVPVVSAVAGMVAAMTSLFVSLRLRDTPMTQNLLAEQKLYQERLEELQKKYSEAAEALKAAKAKAGSAETLSSIAERAVDYATQMGGSNEDKLRTAVAAAKRLDNDDNDLRDFTDAQLRIAIEAVLVPKQ
jgi:hypothetical protein